MNKDKLSLNIFDEYEDDSIIADEAYRIASRLKIYITRNKSLFAYISNGEQVLAALFLPETLEDCFSFDVVVAPEAQRQGLGARLVDSAIKEYEYRKSIEDEMGNEEYEYCIEVVNENMKKLLEKKGFHVYDEDFKTGAWMMRK